MSPEITENPAKLLSIVPAIVFEVRINYGKNQLIVGYINRAAVELLGLDPATYDPVAFTIDNILGLIGRGNSADLVQRTRKRLREGGRLRDQYRLQLPSLGTRWLDVVADAELATDGWSVWRGVATDVTALKEAEEAIRQGQERLELAAQAGGIGVWDLDLDTGKCVWDARMHELYGIPAGSFGGSMDKWRAMLSIDNPAETASQWDAVLGTDTVLDTEFEIDRQGDAPRYVRALARMIRGPDGKPRRIVGVNLDVTERWRLQRELEFMASHDALTGLPNRRSFELELQKACYEAHDQKREHVLFYLDLDRFKIVNDSAGHAAGDAFLRLVGNLIQSDRRPGDFTARLGGDEFALVLRDCSLAEAEDLARELIDAIRNMRLPWNGKVYDIGASVGATGISRQSPGPADLMSQADVACYTAKASGRNQVVVYGGQNSLAERHHREILVASGIRRAIETDMFVLFAQDILTLGAARKSPSYGIELLLRMRDDAGRILLPGSFIPAAERYDLMANLDRWVLENALLHHGEALAAVADLDVSINLSANSLNDPSFWPFLRDTLAASALPPERVKFEITETALINNLDSARSFMSAVRAAGYALILDDFGTGLSSFNYLKLFPVDALKIDGSFISQLRKSPVDRVIVESINEIAHKLNIRTIAEFVEDTETLDIVREIGIDQAQGFVIRRPIPLDAMLAEHSERRAQLS